MSAAGGYILLAAIVNFGTGSKVLKYAKELGVTGGTIFLGKGTAKSHLLELLGLDEIRKEIVLMISEADLEEKIHNKLVEKFHMDKPNHGIIFSSPINKFLGVRNSYENSEKTSRGEHNMAYEAIFTIVDRGLAEDVVDAAVLKGAQGGTIINARGAGIHENNTLFSMAIEPEKEIVMILIDRNKSDDVVKAIRETMHIDDPGKGVMFTMDVNRVSGLNSEN